jgi:hypothetical protein
MNYPRAIMAAVGLLTAASSAFSQTTACPGAGGGGGSTGNRTEVVFTFNFPQIMFPSVTGKPYSGQTTTESTQTSANGAHLRQPARTSPMMYRDSMGRIRTDALMTQPMGPNQATRIQRLAQIDDHVAGYRYVIDDFHQIAYRMATCTPTPQAAYAAVQPALVPEAASQPRNTVNTEQLGTQIMQGTTVTGQRTTITFAPGTYQDNDAPVTRVQETWHSTQYNMDFLTKTTSPEGQVNTQTMTSFSAAEPDPALFQPPPGYRIVDETAQFSITIPFQP